MSEQAPVKKDSVFLPKTDFPMKADLPQRGPKRLELPVPLFVPIWTTTPWTLPSNLAVAMHLDLEYAVVRAPFNGIDRHYTVADTLREDFARKLKAQDVP